MLPGSMEFRISDKPGKSTNRAQITLGPVTKASMVRRQLWTTRRKK
jgi:hypothetical protein